MTKAYQQEREELQRLKRELIKNLTPQQRADMAAEAELDLPEFLRLKLTLAEIKEQIARSETAFSKVIKLAEVKQRLGHTNFPSI